MALSIGLSAYQNDCKMFMIHDYKGKCPSICCLGMLFSTLHFSYTKFCGMKFFKGRSFFFKKKIRSCHVLKQVGILNIHTYSAFYVSCYHPEKSYFHFVQLINIAA
uniref:Uncharacterized protein n=1 Tax=Micrurus spixii TaxID=129469 RepID=A0A2D4LMY8_9SAUR